MQDHVDMEAASLSVKWSCNTFHVIFFDRDLLCPYQAFGGGDLILQNTPMPRPMDNSLDWLLVLEDLVLLHPLVLQTIVYRAKQFHSGTMQLLY